MRRLPGWRAAAFLAVALPASAHGGAGAAVAAEHGVTAERVLFGQSAAFSGPAQELGRNMRLGIGVAFAEANARGGVHGRRLELKSLDDAYEPEAAIANTARLANEEKVFALIGAVGTPTSRSAVPVAAAAGVPYVAPFTGAEFLRSAKLRNVVNLRASYYQETEEMVRRLIADRGIDRIAVCIRTTPSAGPVIAGFSRRSSARADAGGHGRLPAQHHGGQDRPARPAQRRPRRGGPGRGVPAGRGLHRVGQGISDSTRSSSPSPLSGATPCSANWARPAPASSSPRSCPFPPPPGRPSCKPTAGP